MAIALTIILIIAIRPNDTFWLSRYGLRHPVIHSQMHITHSLCDRFDVVDGLSLGTSYIFGHRRRIFRTDVDVVDDGAAWRNHRRQSENAIDIVELSSGFRIVAPRPLVARGALEISTHFSYCCPIFAT